jgi:hypothetical protein
MSDHAGRDNGILRVTIREAASRLGVTEGAIRKRIQRGSLDKDLGEDGRVYVYLDLYQDMSHPESQVHHEAQVQQDGLLEELREQIRYLREQLDKEREARTEERRRHDTLMAQLMQRIPELEAPGASESAEEGREMSTPTGSSTGSQEPSERPQERSWWRRMFGG